MRQRTVGICAYCGTATRSLEPDHVPPASLFASPRPNNLITVPACKRCHSPTSKDDEYFKLVLSMREDVHDHPDIKGGVLAASLRSLQRPRARRYARSFLQTVHKITLRTPAGLYVGSKGGYVADGDRVCREAERIVRGLYFHEKRVTLGRECQVRVFEDSFIDWSLVDEGAKDLIKRTVATLAAADQVHIGTAFAYSRGFDSQDARASAWLLKFYGRVTFLGLTIPS